MTKAHRRGKDTERSVARLVGGKRVGWLGGEDVEHELFSFECKAHSGEPPRWVLDALEQARSHAGDKVPVVVHQYHRGSGKRMLTVFVMDERAWLDLHGEGS